jgi:nucleoid DNA-binding protein
MRLSGKRSGGGRYIKMTKNDIARALSRILSSKKEAESVVNKVFEEMSNSLKNGDKVVITGFGSFNMFKTKAKRGRNPRTCEKLFIAPMKKIRFKQSKNFFE